MKGQMNTEMGKIIVDEDVLAKYAVPRQSNVLVLWEWHPLVFVMVLSNY